MELLVTRVIQLLSQRHSIIHLPAGIRTGLLSGDNCSMEDRTVMLLKQFNEFAFIFKRLPVFPVSTLDIWN